jgi:hypothetical protein
LVDVLAVPTPDRPTANGERPTNRTSEIRYRYDEELTRRATSRFLGRRARNIPLLITIALCVAVLFVLQETWWAASAVVALALFYVALVVRYRWSAKKLARRLGSIEITVRADESGITFNMPAQQSASAWTNTREIWQFGDVWLFFAFGPTTAFTAIPTAAMTPEFREMVLTNMRAHGATVR